MKKYDYMMITEIGELIPKPEVVTELLNNGYYVVPNSFINRYMDDEHELIMLKLKIKNKKLIEAEDYNG